MFSFSRSPPSYGSWHKRESPNKNTQREKGKEGRKQQQRGRRSPFETGSRKGWRKRCSKRKEASSSSYEPRPRTAETPAFVSRIGERGPLLRAKRRILPNEGSQLRRLEVSGLNRLHLRGIGRRRKVFFCAFVRSSSGGLAPSVSLSLPPFFCLLP